MERNRKSDKSRIARRPAADPSEVLDAIMDAVAWEHAATAEDFSPEEDLWAQKLRKRIDGQLAALRRQRTLAQPPWKALPPVPEELLALDREALIARVTSLQQSSGVRYAHHDLTTLTLEDLRRLIVAIVELPRKE